MIRTNCIEDLKTYVQNKKEGVAIVEAEKKKLREEVELLEVKLSTDLEYEEYQECKGRLEYSKDKLEKAINTKVETPKELIRDIDKNVLFISEDIQKEYEENVQKAYDNFKNSLKEIIEILDKRNIQANELNTIISDEKGINERSLKLEALNEFTNDKISIYSDSNGQINIKQRYGSYGDDFHKVYIK